MQINYDFDFDVHGNVQATHFIETTAGKYPQFVHPTLGVIPVDVIQLVKAWHVGTIPLTGTGWDVITKHPLYPGQTRLAALVGEIVRLNDTAARAILGV